MHFDFHYTFHLTKLFWPPPLYYGKLFGPPLLVTQNFFGPPPLCPAPPTKVFMNAPLHIIPVSPQPHYFLIRLYIYQQSCRPGHENGLCSRGWCPTGQSVTRESYLQITTESVAGRVLADSRPPIPQNILKMSRSPVSKRYSFSSSSCGNVHTSNPMRALVYKLNS